MTYLSKLFAVWAIKLKYNVFLKARLVLTAFYIFVITIIIGFFSLLLYFNLAANIKDSLRNQFYDDVIEQEVYTETIDRVGDIMILSDLSVIAVLALFSYFLAGRTLQPIQRSVENQKRFSADASHELRTPLSIIQNEIEIILRNKSAKTEDLEKVLRSNLEEVERMRKIVADLLMMARSTNPIKDEKKSEINLSEMTEKISGRLKSIAENKNLEFKKDIEKGLKISGNPQLLERALLNILQNAIEYTDHGMVSIKIFKNVGKVIFIVSDTGPGIPEKDLKNIFERFYRSDFARESKKEGTGLGLVIADQIIKNHNGKIEIKSSFGQGTTVLVNFFI